MSVELTKGTLTEKKARNGKWMKLYAAGALRVILSGRSMRTCGFIAGSAGIAYVSVRRCARVALLVALDTIAQGACVSTGHPETRNGMEK